MPGPFCRYDSTSFAMNVADNAVLYLRYAIVAEGSAFLDTNKGRQTLSTPLTLRLAGAMLAALLLCFAGQTASAQHTTDHSTDRVSPDRSSNSLSVRDLRPPLRLDRTVFSDGPRNPKTLLVFDDFLLVSTIPDSLQFSLYDQKSGEVLWTESLGQSDENASPVASYAEGKVILGGASGFRVLNVETGEELWRDDSVGISSGRSPVLTGSVALYAGSERIRRADPTTGEVVWERASGALEAPLARWTDALYALEANGNLIKLDVSTGDLIWQVDNAGSDFSSLIVTEAQVFVSDFAAKSVSAYSAQGGELIWRNTEPSLARSTSIVLGSGQLFVFIPSEDQGNIPGSLIRSYNPRTGNLLWETRERFEGGIIEGFEPNIDDGIAANGLLYYRSITTGGKTVARDAFTGSIAWIIDEGFRIESLAIAGDSLFLLSEDFVFEGGTSVAEKSRVDIYHHADTLFFPQVADGGGQTTRISLTNSTAKAVKGTIRFFGPDGEPLQVPLKGVEGEVSSVDFTIQPGSGLEVQTLGGETLKTGHVRVNSDGPLEGVSIFGFENGSGMFEAGIEAARPTNRAVVNVSKNGRFSTALAIAAPSEKEGASLQFFLLSRAGELLAQSGLLLDRGAQTAQFVEELFTEAVGSEFEGILVVESGSVFVATAIRTVDGLQVSSFPVNPGRR